MSHRRKPRRRLFRGENLHGWEQQLERGLPLETRKMKAHRIVAERQQNKKAA